MNWRLMSTAKKTGSQNAHEYERIPRDESDEDIVTSEILRAALNHVNAKGWTEEALKAGT